MLRSPLQSKAGCGHVLRLRGSHFDDHLIVAKSSGESGVSVPATCCELEHAIFDSRTDLLTYSLTTPHHHQKLGSRTCGRLSETTARGCVCGGRAGPRHILQLRVLGTAAAHRTLGNHAQNETAVCLSLILARKPRYW